MTPDLAYLSAYALLVILTILTQVLAAVNQVGLSELEGNREGLQLFGLAGRMERTVTNSIPALALISPAVIIIEISNKTSGFTSQLMLAFFVARVAYVFLYGLNISWFRTVAWLLGFACTVTLYLLAIGG